jgi:hypothetical protein
MLINHKYKFIFIHIPKNAGTSMRGVFGALENTESYDMPNPHINIKQLEKNLLNPNLPTTHNSRRHITTSELKENMENSWNDYFKFAFIRNPFERLVSFYHFYKTKQFQQWRPNHKMTKEVNSYTFSEWVQHRKVQQKSKKVPIFKLPQTHWTDAGENQLVDYIGRYENIEEDYKYVLDKLKIKYEPLPLYNKSYHNSCDEYYDDYTISVAKWWYKSDIDRFNYTYGN